MRTIADQDTLVVDLPPAGILSLAMGPVFFQGLLLPLLVTRSPSHKAFEATHRLQGKPRITSLHLAPAVAEFGKGFPVTRG